MTASAAAAFAGRDLELELLDAGSTALMRLFRHPGGDWQPPPEMHRNLRVDPPAGHKGDFAVLYTGSTLATVAIECGVLHADPQDRYTWAADRVVFISPSGNRARPGAEDGLLHNKELLAT